MKNIYLSLNASAENELLKNKLSNDPEFNLIDADEIKDHKCTIIVNGPLTETANLLLNRYKLNDNIEEILFVGGTDSYGDVTAVAEKNIYDDIKSAQAVFLSEVHIVIFGLNVTRHLDNRALLPYMYLKDKTAFTTDECGAYIETQGTCTLGKMVIDVYSDKQFEQHNCEIILDFDNNKYKNILKG